MSTLERAIALAAEAHTGQKDKAGKPYILHPLRVMLAQQSDDARIVAVLHDTVEDTGLTISALSKEGFPARILDAILSVSRNEGETYDDFIARALKNPIGRLVKKADLEDNCDLTRIAHPTEKDFRRVEKYKRALRMFDY
jgi:hypothetical protein